MTTNKQEFQDSIKAGLCPFCNKQLKYYDGALGYDAMRCYDCNFSLDYSGMHFEDLQLTKI